jgi:CRP-like cAMP-binding protein
MDARLLRDKANEALARGRFAQAAELLEQCCALEPQDSQSRLRLGDTWAKAGDLARASAAYEAAAEGFAREGLLPRAIATSKRLLELQPSHRGVQRKLASLYAARSAPEPRAPLYIELPPEIDAALEAELPDVPAPPPASPLAPELELEFTAPPIEADSLLHAVERAALAAAAAPRSETAEAAETPEPEEAPHAPVLPEIPLFSDLPRDAFIALFERCPLHRVALGTRLIEQGSRGNAFYVICAGRVRIVRESPEGARELAVLGEGAFFGEMALLSGAPRSASAVAAADDTQVLEIPAHVLADLSGLYPQVARALRRFCRQRLLSEVVKTSALFKPFGREDRRALVERFRAREVRRGGVVVHEGLPVDGLYVVLSGEVAVSKDGQRLATLREGELFGEMSLLHKTAATATVTALRRTSLLRLPREDFDSLILTHPQILVLVADLTEARQRSTEAVLGARPSGSTAASSEQLLLV